MRRNTTDPTDSLATLRQSIERAGYYPEIVWDGVMTAVAGEDVVASYVHHEPTIEHDEVRRHITVVVLTANRLILAHTDEHAGDEMLPEPYTSTSTEAIALDSVKTVAVTRMVPASHRPAPGSEPAVEAVLTIGWGAVGRIDLEPAGCADPNCDADHGYTGTLASDDFSLRVSAAAEGRDAVSELLGFAAALSAYTQGPR